MANRPSSRRNPASQPTAALSSLALTRALLLSIAALAVLAALFVGGRIAGHGTSAAAAPAFLQPALGKPQSSAPLVRKPSRDLRVAIGKAGYSVTRGGHSV